MWLSVQLGVRIKHSLKFQGPLSDFCHTNMTLQHVCSFVTDLNLVTADLPFHSSIGFTYMRDYGSASSWPDHFICDTSLMISHLFCGLWLQSFWSFASSLLSSSWSFCTPPPPSSAPTQSTKSHIAWHAADSDLIRSYCDLVSHYLPSLPNSICDYCDASALDWFC